MAAVLAVLARLESVRNGQKGSCRKLSLRDVRVDGVIERGKCGAQKGRCLRGETQVEYLESGTQDAGVDLGEKERHAPTIGRQDVSFLMIEPRDPAFAVRRRRSYPIWRVV